MVKIIFKLRSDYVCDFFASTVTQKDRIEFCIFLPGLKHKREQTAGMFNVGRQINRTAKTASPAENINVGEENLIRKFYVEPTLLRIMQIGFGFANGETIFAGRKRRDTDGK